MKELLNEYIDVWKRKLEENEKYVDDVRKMKHDMQAHFVVLQYYLDSGMYEDAKLYLKVIRNHQEFERKSLEIDLGNALVNVIVEEYISKGHGIICCSNGKIPKTLGMSEYDLCILFSNLISNAVEACEKLSNDLRMIRVNLCENEGKFEISIENPIDGNVDKELLGKGTTKGDIENHGYGIRNVKEVVYKYAGEMEFQIIDSMFRVKIIVPESSNKEKYL